jgi:hypothetical protein
MQHAWKYTCLVEEANILITEKLNVTGVDEIHGQLEMKMMTREGNISLTWD